MITQTTGGQDILNSQVNYVENRMAEGIASLLEGGCDPAWIAHAGMKASMEIVIGLEPEEQREYFDFLEEIIGELRDTLTV